MHNPYRIMGIQERNYTTKEDETLTVDPDTGQYYTMKKISKNKTVMHDSLVYTKLFQDSVKQLMVLSYSSLKVFLYGTSNVRPLSETIILNPPDVCLFCNMGNSSFYTAIDELLGSGIVKKKLGSRIEFWFDPNVFFNGNRIKIK